MSEIMKPVAEWAAAILEGCGIAVIVLAALYTLGLAGWYALRRADANAAYRNMRERLGRGILLGLEFLVAADIIHTVAVELTFKTVGVLATIVLVRTFLSFTLEVELTGQWPWQRKPGSREPGAKGASTSDVSA